MPRWLEFLLFEHIGAWIIAGLVGLLGAGIVFIISLIPRFGRVRPASIPSGFVLALLLFATLPSQPRYNFENKLEAQIESAPWVVVVKRTKVASLLEPRTLFDAPIGSYMLAQPQPYGLYEDGNVDLRVSLIRYRQPTLEWSVTTDCENREANWSDADGSGVFVNNSQGYSALSDEEFMAFCETDWAPIHQTIMQKALGNRD